MNRLRTPAGICFALLLIVSAGAPRARSQAFVNLNFEQVVLADPPLMFYGSVLDVPGWTFSHISPPQLAGHLGSSPQQFLVNDLIPPVWPPWGLLEGHFSLYLEEGTLPPDFNQSVGPWIEQAGLVPAGARSVRFRQSHAPYVPGDTPWIISLDGTELVNAPLPGGILSADVTALAGGVHTLRIAIDPTFDIPAGPNLFNSLGVVDAIYFSPLEYTVAPEPNGAFLACLAVIASNFTRKRR
jgi:hypothetical protein